MKFWLTVVVGVIVVAGGSTALMVLSPSIQPTGPAAKKPEPEKVDLENSPLAEVVGPLEVTHEYVTKGEKGQEIFTVKNEGKRTLVLTPDRATCQCTHLYISDRIPSPSEAAPKLTDEHSNHKIEPGKVGYVVARWSTENKDGKQNVGVPVRTNDPRKYIITFRINLDIHKEFVPSSDTIELGHFDEGQSRSASATIVSLTRPQFEIQNLEVASKWLTAKATPLTAEEAKASKAKAGYRIQVTNDSKIPVGPIEEQIVAYVKTPKSSEAVRFMLRGHVWGDFDTLPEGAVIDFKVVTADTYRPRKIFVFAKKLDKSDTLSVGTVKPESSLGAKIEKNGKQWTLTVSIKPNAPGGNIENGSVALVDSAGRERLVFRVIGLIDPGFRQTAAR